MEMTEGPARHMPLAPQQLALWRSASLGPCSATMVCTPAQESGAESRSAGAGIRPFLCSKVPSAKLWLLQTVISCSCG